MDTRISRIAALANMAAYNGDVAEKYIDGAPHIKHASLRKLYGEQVVRVFDNAKKYTDIPRVLDLGAGEGSVTLPFLELGAKVVAVDISSRQLETLKAKCEAFGKMLVTRCEDINETLQQKNETYDIIVVNSFLHHVPDFLRMIEDASALLNRHGQFFSFQDPLRYDTIGRLNWVFSRAAYLSWRVFKGDVIGGVLRRFRRARGIYLDDSVHDNGEFHVVRNGVDQVAIRQLFENLGFDCDVVTYFSTHGRSFQLLGSLTGMKNTFAVVAQKRELLEP